VKHSVFTYPGFKLLVKSLADHGKVENCFEDDFFGERESYIIDRKGGGECKN